MLEHNNSNNTSNDDNDDDAAATSMDRNSDDDDDDDDNDADNKTNNNNQTDRNVSFACEVLTFRHCALGVVLGGGSAEQNQGYTHGTLFYPQRVPHFAQRDGRVAGTDR